MAGDERHAARHFAMRHRDAEHRGDGYARGDAADHLVRDVRRFERFDFFAAAPEYQRVAALQARHDRAAAREGHHEPLDEVLGSRLATAALADVYDARIGAGVQEHFAMDEIVDQYHVGIAEHARRLERNELGVTGAGADQEYFAEDATCVCGRHTFPIATAMPGRGAYTFNDLGKLSRSARTIMARCTKVCAA